MAKAILMGNNIQHISPDTMPKNPAYSQAVITHGSGKTIYVGGQNSVNANGEITGKGDIQVQVAQTMKNVETVLAACGASMNHVAKLSVHIVQGQDIAKAFEAARPSLSAMENPPAVTVTFVAGLGRPDFLVEVDAIAFLPE